jgi:ribonuclease PH
MRSTVKTVAGVLYSGGKMVRAAGRGPAEMRTVEIIPDFISSAEGSALIRLGETQVICTATVDDGAPQFMKGRGSGWISSEYAMIPRATNTRTPREASRGRQSGRTMEIQRLIGRSLRAVADLAALGERTVWIDCDVIRADGGTRTASITGAMVALGLAFKKLVQEETLKSIPLKDTVAAISAGIIGGERLLDLDFAEDSNAEVDMNIVLTGSGRLVEIQATGEGHSFSIEELNQMVDLARPAIGSLVALQQKIISFRPPTNL